MVRNALKNRDLKQECTQNYTADSIKQIHKNSFEKL